MNQIRVTCPHCNQVLEARESDVGKKLRCVNCNKAFRNEGEVPVAAVAYEAGRDVIKVNCQECDDKFGLKPAMSEKSVACPHCKTRQKFVLTPREPAAKVTEDDGAGPGQPMVKSAATSSGRATVVHAGTAALGKPSELTARARDLLPPKYTVNDSVERQAALDLGIQVAPPTALHIDTEVTRIHRESGDSVPVRSLSRDQKGRRKSLRVAIIYVVSVIILVTLCIILVQSVGSDI